MGTQLLDRSRIRRDRLKYDRQLGGWQKPLQHFEIGFGLIAAAKASDRLVLAISQQAIDHPRMQKILIAHGLVQTNATLVQDQANIFDRRLGLNIAVY